MSRFSGKCDFCDEIEIFGTDRILNAEVYIGHSTDYPLELNCLADCVPYYPYVTTCAVWTKERDVIHLTERSWVDIEEERYGPLLMHEHYRKALAEEIEKANRKEGIYAENET